MEHEECPLCDAGTITTYRVVATGETIRVCDRCDAVWEAADELPSPAPTTLEQFLEVRGRPPLWTELERTPKPQGH